MLFTAIVSHTALSYWILPSLCKGLKHFPLQAGTEHPPPQLLVHPLTCLSFPFQPFLGGSISLTRLKKKKTLWIDGLKGRHNSNYTI